MDNIDILVSIFSVGMFAGGALALVLFAFGGLLSKVPEDRR